MVLPHSITHTRSGAQSPPSGLAIELDEHAQILRVSGDLAASLPTHGLVGSGLSRWLNRTHSRAITDELLPGHLETVDIEIPTQQAQVHLRMWAEKSPAGYCLYGLPIQDLLQTPDSLQRRLNLSLAAQVAARLRATPAERLADTCQEALQSLARDLCVGQLALAIYHEEHWQLFAHYSATPEQPLRWVSGMKLGDVFSQLNDQGPLLWPNHHTTNACEAHLLLGQAPALLVPYQELGSCRAWLLLDHPSQSYQSEELLCSFAIFASSLLQRLGQRQNTTQQKRLQLLQGLLGAAWWAYRPEDQTLEVSDNLAEHLKLPTHTTLETWLSRLYPADRDEFQARLKLQHDTDTELVQCLRLRPENNSEQPYQWFRLQAQTQGQGHTRKLCGFVVNIDENMQQEAQTRAAHARLSNLVARSPAVIYLQNCHEGAFELSFCSDSLDPLLGYQLEDLQQGQLVQYIHPDDLQQYFDRGRQLLREGHISCRYRLIDRQGHYHWLLDEAKLLRDEKGHPQEVVGLWLDVTEATEAAERIRQSEERYRILVEDSPAMICRLLPDLSIIFANKPLLDYLELDATQLSGTRLSQWLSTEQRHAFSTRLANLSPEQPVSQAEVCIQLPGREHAWWVWAERGVFDEYGHLLEIHAVGRDNTEVRRSQQQLNQSAKMATLGEMATGMAHEMNQPLHVMRMAVANVLRRLELGDVPHDYLQEKLLRIDAQVQRAARIVDHMRVFGRRSEIEPKLFDPCQAIEGSTSLLQEALQSKGVDLQVRTPKALQTQVLGHSDQLEQVLINLMVNARDALLSQCDNDPDLKPWIRVQLEQKESAVHIRVEDNGGGIDPRLHERIFDPFFTTKDVGKGTGLGLSVSYNIIKQMHGQIHVENTENGACFHISLPLRAQTAQVEQV